MTVTAKRQCIGYPRGVWCDREAKHPERDPRPLWCEDHEQKRRAAISDQLREIQRSFRAKGPL